MIKEIESATDEFELIQNISRYVQQKTEYISSLIDWQEQIIELQYLLKIIEDAKEKQASFPPKNKLGYFEVL